MSEQSLEAGLGKHVAVFACGGVSYTDKDVIDAACFRGELEPAWRALMRCIECENQAGDQETEEGAINEAAEAFRYKHDLITAEETEHWLDTYGLSLHDFGDYFTRRYWGTNWQEEVGPELVQYISASEKLRALLRADLIFSGEFDKLAEQLSWRLATSFCSKDTAFDPAMVAVEQRLFFDRAGIEESGLEKWLSGIGRDAEWLKEMLRLEGLLRLTKRQLLTTTARRRELTLLRLPLTQFEVELVEVESLDAAREALLCVTDDGLSLEQVAAESRYPFQRVTLLLQDIEPDLQQKFQSASPGKVLEPLAHGDGFQLCRIARKIEPNADDVVLQLKIDQSILKRHFSRVVAEHIQWQGPLRRAA